MKPRRLLLIEEPKNITWILRTLEGSGAHATPSYTWSHPHRISGQWLVWNGHYYPCMLRQTSSSNGSTPFTSFCTAVREINTSESPLKFFGNVTVPKGVRGALGFVSWLGYSYSNVTLAPPLRLFPTNRTVQPLALLVRAPSVTRQARRRDVRVNESLEFPVAVVLISKAGEPPYRFRLSVPELIILGGEGIVKYCVPWFCCVATTKPR